MRSNCPISTSLEIFGDKWSLLIIRDMMFFGKSTYGDFLKSDEGIATNILASRLQTLEEDNLIEKREHSDSRVRYHYKLTQKSIDLLPLFVELHLWVEKHYEISPQFRAIILKDKKSNAEYLKEVSNQLRKKHLV